MSRTFNETARRPVRCAFWLGWVACGVFLNVLDGSWLWAAVCAATTVYWLFALTEARRALKQAAEDLCVAVISEMVRTGELIVTRPVHTKGDHTYG